MRRGQTHQSLGALLDRYRTTLRAPQKTVVNEVVKAYSTLGITCDERFVSYNKNTKTISLGVSGPLKTEMLLRKGQVLALLVSTLRKDDIPSEIL